jgi:hypothetical protein
MQMIDPSVGRLNLQKKAATSQLTPDGLWFRYVSMGHDGHLVFHGDFGIPAIENTIVI